MLNETPKVSPKKTKLAPKSIVLALFGVAILLAASFAMCFIVFGSTAEEVATAEIRGQSFRLDVADTTILRQKGLSSRYSLAADEAMLFVFQATGNHCFWMKDMRFAIDIAWLDDDKKIIDMQKNVTPDSYPSEFCPTKDALYVLEFSAGTIEAVGMIVGDQVVIRGS